MKIIVPFVYQVEPISETDRLPRNHRAIKRRFRRSEVEIEIDEVSQADVPLAFQCTTTSQLNLVELSVPYRVHRGALVRPVIAWNHKPGTPKDLLNEAEHPFSATAGLMHWSENPFLTSPKNRSFWYGSMLAPREEKTNARHQAAREERLAELESTFARCILVDKALYRPTIEPVWAMMAVPSGIFMSVSINSDVSKPTVAFRVDNISMLRFTDAFYQRTGDRPTIVNRNEGVKILRPDMIARDARELICDGVFDHFVNTFNELIPGASAPAREILRAAVTARDEIQNMGFVPEALDRHMNTLRRIAQSDKIFADCAFTSNAQERRFSRNGVELLHAISASLEAL